MVKFEQLIRIECSDLCRGICLNLWVYNDALKQTNRNTTKTPNKPPNSRPHMSDFESGRELPHIQNCFSRWKESSMHSDFPIISVS